MFRINHKRNAEVYPLWERGDTIDQIASATRIPRSSVGYFVRKFNRLARKGEPIIIPQQTREDQNKLFMSAHLKLDLVDQIQELIKQRDWEKLYHFTGSFERLKQINLQWTPEEKEAFSRVLATIINTSEQQWRGKIFPAKPSSSAPIRNAPAKAKRAGPSLDEIFP